MPISISVIEIQNQKFFETQPQYTLLDARYVQVLYVGEIL